MMPAANNQNKTDGIKEERKKHDRKPLEFPETCKRSCVDICDISSYDCKIQSFNEFMDSSKIFPLFLNKIYYRFQS